MTALPAQQRPTGHDHLGKSGACHCACTTCFDYTARRCICPGCTTIHAHPATHPGR